MAGQAPILLLQRFGHIARVLNLIEQVESLLRRSQHLAVAGGQCTCSKRRPVSRRRGFPACL
jgi:hypothetical protein